MVAQQILRVAVAAAVAAPAAAGAGETTAIIDLRAGDAAARRTSRTDLARRIAADPAFAPIADAALASALAGDGADALTAAAEAALADARAAYGGLDCATAAAAATRAIDALAAMQARGDDVRDALAQAHVYVLLCSGDDGARAQATAARLRALGADPPPGVSASLWAKYPEVDATSNVFLAPVAIEATPAGAELWIDFAMAGTAPMTAHLAEGEHVVAAAAGGGATATRLEVRGRGQHAVALAVAAPEVSPALRAIGDWVDGWRSGKRPPTPRDIYLLLDTVGVRLAIVLAVETATGAERVEAWARPPRAKTATLLGSGRTDQLDEVLKLAKDRLQAWDLGHQADPVAPHPRAPKPEDEGTYRSKPWWIYAAIGAAVVGGVAAIVAAETAEDRQVVRVTYP
jgi:hypothetical protein